MADNYQNPDFAPDLPFLWKSTEWAKPGGRIAVALPARILFKQEEIPRRARETMFRLIEITGIINGSNLSDTDVWPNMSQPFLLMFARNRRPKDGQVIRVITPHYDKVLNRKGELRIDSKSAQPVEVGVTFDEPWLWKALAVGTSLDAEVVRRLNSASGKSLESYWEDDLGLSSGSGYMVKPRQRQQDASLLRGLPDLARVPTGTFVVNPSEFPKFSRNTVCWPRDRDIYRAPLALMKQAPGPDRTQGWALLSLADDVAFNQSLHGYSGAKHPEGTLLVQYLHLFAHCDIRLYYALITRPRFGSERRVLDKGDLDECPVIPLANLTAAQRQVIPTLSRRLVAGDRSVFDEIDAFFGELFGLDKLDLEVIHDTLDVGLPWAKSRARACDPPTPRECEAFGQRLESLLRPFFNVLVKEPRVMVWKRSAAFLYKAPFGIVLISERGGATAEPDVLFQDLVLRLADDTGSTRIIQLVDGGLLVSILSQYRYWTPSRARLLAAEIVRQHMGAFES